MGYHDLEAERPNASGSLRNAHGRKETLSRKTKCSVFIHIIFSPSMISSGFYFNMIALFRKCRSNALVLSAIAIIVMSQGRGLRRYNSMLPTGQSQNKCFLLPQRTKSSAFSTSSHCEQNCCMQTRSGTCNVALSEYIFSLLCHKIRTVPYHLR